MMQTHQFRTGSVEANPTRGAAGAGLGSALFPFMVRNRLNVNRMRARTTGIPMYDPIS